MGTLTRVVAGVGVLALAGVGAGAVYFADQLTATPTVRPFEPDNEVVAADDRTVTLRDEGFAAQDGTWGLQLPQQRHVVLGEVVARGDGTVTRTFDDLVGVPGPQPDEPVRVDEFVWVGTPDSRGLAWEAITLDGPQGPLPAWFVPADGAAAGRVVLVHGRGATLEESLRFLPTLHEAGWEVVVTSYRGDEGAPPLPGGRALFGTDSWQDVVPAITWDRDPALPVVLYGISMGGAVVGQLLDRAPEAAEVDAVVLDSPVLSLDELLVLQGELNGVPRWANPVLLPLVQLVAEVRHGLDTGSLEQVARDDTLGDRPVLLFHGDDDQFVPAGPSVAFADTHADTTTFVRVPDAGHVRTWNVARDRYEDALRSWLAELG